MASRLARAADDARTALERGLHRLRDRLALLAQIGVGVVLAWTLASQVLGHTQPFFAPVTALICLGLTYGQRLRRIVEVTLGVAVGVLVGDGVVLLLGSGPLQMALVVVTAMAIAVVLSSGQLVVIQAGVQSVFIVAFAASAGQGLSRWVDALVGGLVALVLGTLAPTTPVARPRAEAARTVRGVAATLDDVAAALRTGDAAAAVAALEGARALEARLGDLRLAAAEGVAAVRQSPLLRHHRPQAVAASALVVPLDRCVRNLRVLARRAAVAVRRSEQVPPRYVDLVAELARAAEDLARVLDEHTLPSAGRGVLERVAGLSARAEPAAGLSAEMVRGQVRSMVVDLLVVAGMDDDDALELVPESHLP
ncbi:aromatic acid exporter family protein [Phycicoccus sp. HDW14]|uniref:FUSC family protein n=1 Tax=Phycicoccus sp. HDW14 TaxID=2714941 RepID=UPI00140B456D|nr:FUSC family protein [Phycicoccus sp. HDW14]QIM21009.1 aromatic acid exporter family protein [Phycicoccus sp. HDW14]